MTTKAADDFDSIARRLAEIEADADMARTGSSVPAKEEKAEDLPMGYGDYLGGMCGLGSLAHPQWPYAGTAHEWRGFVQGVGNGASNFYNRLKASG
jgi:hypothetical protein